MHVTTPPCQEIWTYLLGAQEGEEKRELGRCCGDPAQAPHFSQENRLRCLKDDWPLQDDSW